MHIAEIAVVFASGVMWISQFKTVLDSTRRRSRAQAEVGRLSHGR